MSEAGVTSRVNRCRALSLDEPSGPDRLGSLRIHREVVRDRATSAPRGGDPSPSRDGPAQKQPGATPCRAGSSPCTACCRSAGGNGAPEAGRGGPGERVPNGKRSSSGSLGQACALARPNQKKQALSKSACDSELSGLRQKEPACWGRRVGVGGFLPLLVNCPAWVIRPADEAHACQDNAETKRGFRAAF